MNLASKKKKRENERGKNEYRKKLGHDRPLLLLLLFLYYYYFSFTLENAQQLGRIFLISLMDIDLC
jgi:hypothetical protein